MDDNLVSKRPTSPRASCSVRLMLIEMTCRTGIKVSRRKVTTVDRAGTPESVATTCRVNVTSGSRLVSDFFVTLPVDDEIRYDGVFKWNVLVSE